MKKILVAPANFGLGHATRTIPIIRELQSKGHNIHIATSGAALILLKKEFPDIICYELPDYPHGLQSAGTITIKNLITEISKITASYKKENNVIKTIDKQNNYDMIISDGRYGAYIESKPSLIITHQLNFKLNKSLKIFEPLTAQYNKYYFNNFDRIIIPDNESRKISLAGDLSNVKISGLDKKAYYAGILCSIKPVERTKDIDVLVSISGPEPCRSELEDIIMKQIGDVREKTKIILLGKPGDKMDYMLDANTRIISHADRNTMSELMGRSKTIVSRSGYTTIMELANLGHNNCFFIPTPGCFEQEYLAKKYLELGWFYSKIQKKLNLVSDLNQTNNYKGFPKMPRSEDNIKKLYEQILVKYL